MDKIFYASQMNMYAYVGNDPVNAVDPTGMATSLVVNAFRIGVRTRKYGNIGGAVRGIGKDISYDWNQLGNDSTATIGQKLGSTADLLLGTAFNESSEGDSSENSENKDQGESSGQRAKNPPDVGPSNDFVQGPRRGREYDENGKPKRDYDKPHQGNQEPHIHEWDEDGIREEPGRPYSPWPQEKQ